MVRKALRLKTGTVGLVLASTFAGGILGLSFGREKINVPSYRAVRVIEWFCTENEAEKAGYVKAKTCP